MHPGQPQPQQYYPAQSIVPQPYPQQQAIQVMPPLLVPMTQGPPPPPNYEQVYAVQVHDVAEFD
jgi:hypothetical protein